ncbi:hypothetical protein ACFC36_15835 [Streptomyces rubiginosohelvolus]|uniref:hypothetical protein n=1 Tax=Streptomyces rubiginosohelvolus TaxID=67362 RepID=UPI0035DB8C46
MSPHRRPFVSRVLALPEKGEPQRRTAITAWGLIATTAVFTTTFGLVERSREEAAEGRASGMAATVPDAEPEDDGVYRDGPASGYVPTYFDGHGGIAGVPLTEEQRDAVVREALRRGVSHEDARALAYGEGTAPLYPDAPKEKSPSPGMTVLAAAPIYREVAPLEKRAGGGDGPAAPGVPDPKLRHESGGRQQSGRREEKGKGRTKPGVKEQMRNMVESVVPDRIEKPLGEVLGPLNPFRSYMKAISLPGTEPLFTVSPPEGGVVTVTAETRVTETMAVTVQVKAPVVETPQSPPPSVSVTVTNPETDAVTAVSEERPVPGGSADIPRVAIGEVVEAVVAAASEPDAPREDEKSANEAVHEAKDALREIKGEPAPAEGIEVSTSPAPAESGGASASPGPVGTN